MPCGSREGAPGGDVGETDITLSVPTSDGQYIVQRSRQGALWALRNGQPWQPLNGDNLVLSLAQDLHDAREALALAEGFMSGFEDDETQENVKWMLETIRKQLPTSVP